MGGEEEDDPQRVKRIGAAAYDYENDPRWAGYWSNILIPPHMASRSDVVDHFKRKFYRRYIVSILTLSTLIAYLAVLTIASISLKSNANLIWDQLLSAFCSWVLVVLILALFFF